MEMMMMWIGAGVTLGLVVNLALDRIREPSNE
jgi:hypothetical protein